MKKKLISIFLAAAMTMSLTACAQETTGGDSTTTTAAGGDEGTTTTAAPQGGNSGETITLRVWGGEEDQALLSELADDFKAAHPDQTFDIQVGVESESTAKDTVLTDISAAADVFAFASDQIASLVRAGALANLDTMNEVLTNYSGKSIDDVKAANSAGTIGSATFKDNLYAFPMSGGNNYFLYYDANVLSEDDVKSWDTMLAKAAEAGKQVGMTLASGWYLSSFFMGAGFVSSTNDDGTTNCDWNGTSGDGYTGVQVVEGILGITNSSAFLPVADGDLSNQIASGNLCAVVDGTWDADAARAAFGEGYRATKLPTFTCNGTQLQQYTYTGSKLIGVNALSENVGWATVFAEFLTNEQSQAKRFEQRQLSPSNLVVSERDDVKANIAGAASMEQDNFGSIQDVGEKFWAPTKTLGELCAQKSLTVGDTAGIQQALDTAVEGITAAVS